MENEAKTSELPEVLTKWLCRDCGHVSTVILTAPNPFDPGDTIHGCEKCKSACCLTVACAAEGCNREATGGHPDWLGYRYAWTCWHHGPYRFANGDLPRTPTRAEAGAGDGGE